MADAEITKWYGQRVFDEATDVNVKAMTKAALVVERHIKTNFTNTDGRSAPGEPPAVDTGLLRSSIMHHVVKRMGNVMGFVGITNQVKYGLYLEVGTKNMQPRPFLRPALAKTRRAVMDIFKKANGK